VTLLDQIRQTIARYSMFHHGERLGVAVSGGADSLCLLHALLALQPEFALDLSILHVDHNLRGPESRADAQFVHNCAQHLGLPFHLTTLALDLGSGNLEQEARRARHGFFLGLIRSGVVQKVALGHTRSDQAETVLFRLLRGAGSAGLAGIRPVTSSGLVRPLLQVTRLQVEGWLKERSIAWREDSTNQELRFNRNRIRRQLIPQLEAEWNPALPETLAQTADWALEEERYWSGEIPRLLTPDWVRFAKTPGAAVLDTNRLNHLPVAVARRVIREVVNRVKDDLLGVSFAHVEAIRQLAASAEGSGRVQIAEVEVVRSFHWLRFAKPDAGGRDWEVPLDVSSGAVVSPVGYVVLELTLNKGVYNRSVDTLDWERVGERAGDGGGVPLVLRNWRPGDRYQRQGHTGTEKIKTLFQEHQIPLWERQNWPVLTVGGLIAWAGKFGPAEQFAANPDSRTILRIRVESEGWQ
jgi:tRNA(Ile)-lysidine synthase